MYHFNTFSQKRSPYSDAVSQATFKSQPWRSRSQHDLVTKSCPAHNFVIWSRILQLFHRNDYFIETPCRKQHLGRYLEGQGHSMTLQQKRVRPKTFFWSLILQLFDRNDHYIEMMCHYLVCCLALCILYRIILSSVT